MASTAIFTLLAGIEFEEWSDPDGFISLNFENVETEGPLPAKEGSIEAPPIVEIVEEKTECVICLLEFQVGGRAKEMPCKHRYHSNCINKWLGIHGSCPICRYKMPVERRS